MRDSFKLGNAIKQGVPVAITGSANTGKSTLLNALLGEERALVSDIAGTTRDSIEEAIVLEGTKFRFIDTAGIRDTSDTVERLGIERALDKTASADIVLGVIDSTDSEDSLLSACLDISSRINTSTQNLLILLNKSDLPAAGMVASDAAGAVDGAAAGAADRGRAYVAAVKDVAGGTDGMVAADAVGAVDDASAGAADCHNDKNYMVTRLARQCGIREDSFIRISAKTGSGLETLKQKICAIQKSRMPESTTSLVTNLRHYQELNSACTSLETVLQGLSDNTPSDLIAEDLRAALLSLGSITGSIGTEEILGQIFGKFCIGK